MEEIQKVAKKLDANEKVVVVAKQSRFKPSGSKISPDAIFVTDRWIIIRNSSALGMRENVESITYDKIIAIELESDMMSSTVKIRAFGYQGDIDAILKEKAENILVYVRDAMDRAKKAYHLRRRLADFCRRRSCKACKTERAGDNLDAEFMQMKQEMMKKL